MSSATKLQILSTLVVMGLLWAPSFVPLLLFPQVFHDRPLHLILPIAGILMITVPISFKVNRYLVRRYAEPPEK